MEISFQKIYLITCPTINTLKYIKSLNIIEDNKVKLLYDPIVSIKEINEKKNKEIEFKDYFLSVGRLTKQKIFYFYANVLKKIVETNKSVKLVIIGEGEDELKLKNFIKNNLEKTSFWRDIKKIFFHTLKKQKLLFYHLYGKIQVLF